MAKKRRRKPPPPAPRRRSGSRVIGLGALAGLLLVAIVILFINTIARPSQTTSGASQSPVIHVESPSTQVYTLGDYFDIWGQPLATNQVGPARGPVTAYFDGQRFAGDPRSIPLTVHGTIQLDVGGAAPGPRPFSFPPGY